jgi:hypothetical protein
MIKFRERRYDEVDITTDVLSHLKDDGQTVKTIKESDADSVSKTNSKSLVLYKPFGMNWTNDIMSDFLKKRGYRVITRHDTKSNKDYQVAVKPGDKVISGDGHSNLEKAFEEEVQLILSKWLLSL